MVSEYFNPAKKKMSTALLIILIVVGAILLAFLIFALAYAGTI
jgi:flagellar basal body-associated protein FliL